MATEEENIGCVLEFIAVGTATDLDVPSGSLFVPACGDELVTKANVAHELILLHDSLDVRKYLRTGSIECRPLCLRLFLVKVDNKIRLAHVLLKCELILRSISICCFIGGGRRTQCEGMFTAFAVSFFVSYVFRS